MNRTTQDNLIQTARRFTAGIALLSDQAYTFRRFEEGTPIWFVHSPNGCYTTDLKWGCCSCPDFQQRKEACKHMYACEELLRQEAQCEGYDPNTETGKDEYIPY